MLVCSRPNSVPTGRFGTNRRVMAICPLSCKSLPPGVVPIISRYARASGESDQMNGWAVSNAGSPSAGDTIVDPDGSDPAVNAMSECRQAPLTLDDTRAYNTPVDGKVGTTALVATILPLSQRSL